MITRRSACLVSGFGLLGVPLSSPGQPGTAMRRVGVLFTASEASGAPYVAAFIDGMQALGWQRGNNIDYRFAFANGDVGRLDALVADLLAQRVEVIVVGNPPGIRAAQKATKSVPIIMAYGANAVGNGFVASLSQPGGNITGITSQQEEVLGKLIGLLHEAAPNARRFAVLLNETNPAHVAYWVSAQSACAVLGLVAIRVVANSAAQLGTAVAQIVAEQSQAVVVVTDSMFLFERQALQAQLQAARLPVAYGFPEHVLAGGLLSYAANISESFRYSARYVDKILRGAKPVDLPVEQPIQFEFVINLQTAKALGLSLPQSMLLRADRVLR